MTYRGKSRGAWVDRRAELTAFSGLLVASAIGTAAGARFYPHYYIQIDPAARAPCSARSTRGLWSRQVATGSLAAASAVVTYAWLALTVDRDSPSRTGSGWPRNARPSETGRYLPGALRA